jgi:hypothetical protein
MFEEGASGDLGYTTRRVVQQRILILARWQKCMHIKVTAFCLAFPHLIPLLSHMNLQLVLLMAILVPARCQH